MPLYELHESEKQILEAIFTHILKRILGDSPYKILVPAMHAWGAAYYRDPNLEEFFAAIGGPQNFADYLRTIPYEKYKQILEGVAITSINNSFDAILFPSEIYDHPEEIAKVDTDNLLNKIYGVKCAIQHAVSFFWEKLEQTSFPQMPAQKLALFEQANDWLVENGFFPSASGGWDRDYTASYNLHDEEVIVESSSESTTAPDHSEGGVIAVSRKRSYGAAGELFKPMKRTRLDIGMIWTDITIENLLLLLKTDLETPSAHDWLLTDNPNRGKYHRAVKLLIGARFPNCSELNQYEKIRRLFLHFPLILRKMLDLAEQKQVEFAGKTYSRGRNNNGTGELDLLLELINQACAPRIATTSYFAATQARERRLTLRDRVLGYTADSNEERTLSVGSLPALR